MARKKVCVICSTPFESFRLETCSRTCERKRIAGVKTKPKPVVDMRKKKPTRLRKCRVCGDKFAGPRRKKTCSKVCSRIRKWGLYWRKHREERLEKQSAPEYLARRREKYKIAWATNTAYRERHRNYSRDYMREYRQRSYVKAQNEHPDAKAKKRAYGRDYRARQKSLAAACAE